MHLLTFSLLIHIATSCEPEIINVLGQLQKIGAEIEQHFPITPNKKTGMLIASNTLKDTHTVLMTLAHGAVHFPYCFQAETRLEILSNLTELSNLSAAVFRAYFHSFQLGKVWLYSVDERNNIQLMEIVSKFHKYLAAIYRTLVNSLQHIRTVDENASYILKDHTDTGAFVPTEISLRKAFPEIPESLTDKGVLRALLRNVLPVNATLADLGALDGQYSRWLNDTGLVTSFAFDGVQGVEELTDGRVRFFDLSKAEGGPEGPFDFIICLEVAEHIPKDQEHVFLSHLKRLSKKLVISWSKSADEGVGHVNPKTEQEVQSTMSSIGFSIDPVITAMLRDVAHIPWIKDAVSFYQSE